MNFLVTPNFDEIKETPIFQINNLCDYNAEKGKFVEKIGEFSKQYKKLNEYYSSKKELLKSLKEANEKIEFFTIGSYKKLININHNRIKSF